VYATNDMSPDASGDWLEDEIEGGHTVVTVRDADERAEDVRELLRDCGGSIREPSPVGTYGTGLPATPY
jgi:thiamine monophosphate synthase